MKFHINTPAEANKLIHTLQSHNHSAYVVGGCVRDSILGREPNDWDICTSATPEEMLQIFKNERIIETGLQHGTVTVVINGQGFEITTYRIDGTYSDNRRPDSVSFTSSLLEDLARRDFTINAMAYNDNEGLIDPYSGLEDIERKVIRCVGKASDRFNEDALRILRALRFACQLDFNIHPDISWQLIYTDIARNLKTISAERINNEFVKIVKTKQFAQRLVWNYNIFVLIIPELYPMIGFNQKNPWHIHDVFCHTVHAIDNCDSEDIITRLAVFFHDFGKPFSYQDEDDGVRHFKEHAKHSAEVTDFIMKRLRFDNDTREKVVELVHYHDATFEVGNKYVKRWLNKIGEEQFRRLLEVKIADCKAQNLDLSEETLTKIYKIKEILEEVLLEESCFSLKALSVKGHDLIDIGYKPGRALGAALQRLLDCVIADEVENNKEDLLTLAKGWL